MHKIMLGYWTRVVMLGKELKEQQPRWKKKERCRVTVHDADFP